MFNVDPIGFFHTSSVAFYDVPRQPSLASISHKLSENSNHLPCDLHREPVLPYRSDNNLEPILDESQTTSLPTFPRFCEKCRPDPYNKGIIRLKKGFQFEQALEGLNGFDRIWVVFRFHRHDHWKSKVLPPRGGKKQGVFATRSPHRPNFIGLSCVELESIQGLELFIINHDLIDGTPILDLKPYIDYADSFVSERQGWLDELPPQPPSITIEWSSLAKQQINYLAENWQCALKEGVEHRLHQSPFPYPNNRVKEMSRGKYELAYRTWRVYYELEKDVAVITHLKSGYDRETIQGKKTSKWDDISIHQAFVKVYSPSS